MEEASLLEKTLKENAEEVNRTEDQLNTPDERSQPGNPIFVKEVIDTQLLAQLRDEMGFPELRAEKALYVTKCVDIVTAIDWLSAHENDIDIDEPIPETRKLTKEEAEQKALDLQKRIRENRAKKEKEDSLDKERKRMEMGKSMLDTQRILEEAEKKRVLQQIEKDKQIHEQERKRQLELLREDYERRFGKPYPEEEKSQQETDIQKKSPKEQIAFWMGRLKLRKTDENKESLITCLKTLEAYLQNAYNNPSNPKFHSIRKDNAAFQSRIIPFSPEAIMVLDSVGFKDDSKGFLAIEDLPDSFLLSQAMKFVSLILHQISQ